MASGNSYEILESIYKYFPQENKLWKIKIGPINTQRVQEISIDPIEIEKNPVGYTYFDNLK